jgi:hypothetical protein
VVVGLERTIMGQIKTQLQNINGAGGYVHDLSGEDRIVFGQQFSPARVPGVYLFSGGLSPSLSPGTTRLDSYDRTLTVQIEAWTAPANADTGEAGLQALDLYSDIRRALETDRTLGGNVRDLQVAGNGWDGWELERPGLGLALLVVTINYRQTAGET